MPLRSLVLRKLRQRHSALYVIADQANEQPAGQDALQIMHFVFPEPAKFHWQRHIDCPHGSERKEAYDDNPHHRHDSDLELISERLTSVVIGLFRLSFQIADRAATAKLPRFRSGGIFAFSRGWSTK